MQNLKADLAKVADEEYKKLKDDSKTYGELEEKIRRYNRDASWERDEIKKITGVKMKEKFANEVKNMEILPPSDGS